MSGYIGTQPVPQATQTRDAFTCTAGQTSFATSGYTPSFLDVYLNGIKLAAADYTASNGSDVVLASGAALNDILEVVAYSSFEAAHVTGADDFTVTGSFTSQGIDDNATSTAMTLDASGNLLVGKTSAAFNTAGTYLQPSGLVAATASSSFPMALNRLSTDGDILSFFKDTSTVGSIGNASSGFYINGNSATSGLEFATNTIVPSKNAARIDAALNLGMSTNRFKDLYLSGGVYLGGTGSANKLDDYEYGRFTPSMDATSVTYNARQGDYVKIGKLVNIYVFVNWSAISGWNGNISGLPFTQSSLDTFYPMGQVFNNNGVSYPSGRSTILAYVNDGTSQMTVATVGSAVNAAAPALSTSGYMHISLTYITA
jgi:hypothetical protein